MIHEILYVGRFLYVQRQMLWPVWDQVHDMQKSSTLCSGHWQIYGTNIHSVSNSPDQKGNKIKGE